MIPASFSAVGCGLSSHYPGQDTEYQLSGARKTGSPSLDLQAFDNCKLHGVNETPRVFGKLMSEK